jgi:hypothetical protein
VQGGYGKPSNLATASRPATPQKLAASPAKRPNNDPDSQQELQRNRRGLGVSACVRAACAAYALAITPPYKHPPSFRRRRFSRSCPNAPC